MLTSLPLRPGATELPALASLAPQLASHVSRDRAAARDVESFAKKSAKAAAAGQAEPPDADSLQALLEVALSKLSLVEFCVSACMHSGAKQLNADALAALMGGVRSSRTHKTVFWSLRCCRAAALRVERPDSAGRCYG